MHWYLAGTSTLDDRDPPDSFCSTLILGRLVIQVMAMPASDGRHLATLPRATETYVPAFPPGLETICWPPHKVLDDDGLWELVDMVFVDAGRGFPRLSPLGEQGG